MGISPFGQNPGVGGGYGGMPSARLRSGVVTVLTGQPPPEGAKTRGGSTRAGASPALCSLRSGRGLARMMWPLICRDSEISGSSTVEGGGPILLGS